MIQRRALVLVPQGRHLDSPGLAKQGIRVVMGVAGLEDASGAKDAKLVRIVRETGSYDQGVCHSCRLAVCGNLVADAPWAVHRQNKSHSWTRLQCFFWRVPSMLGGDHGLYHTLPRFLQHPPVMFDAAMTGPTPVTSHHHARSESEQRVSGLLQIDLKHDDFREVVCGGCGWSAVFSLFWQPSVATAAPPGLMHPDVSH